MKKRKHIITLKKYNFQYEKKNAYNYEYTKLLKQKY